MHTTCLIVAAVALTAMGCDSSEKQRPAVPEPARSPPLSEPPAGRVIGLGGMPEGVAADPDTGLVAVGLRRPARLALVDARSGRITRRVPLPSPARHLQLAGPGGPVLVPAEEADALVRVRLPSGRVEASAVGRFPHDAAAEDGLVAVADEFGDTLTVLEGRRPVARLRTAAQPGGVAGAGRGRVAVVAVKDHVVEAFDLRRRRPLGRLPAGAGPTHVAADRDGTLYVIDTTGNAVLVYRLGGRLKQVGRLDLPGAPYGVAIDSRRRRLWVTLTASNRLAELRLTGGVPQRMRELPTVRQPNSVAVDLRSGRVSVAGRADGVLQVLDP